MVMDLGSTVLHVVLFAFLRMSLASAHSSRLHSYGRALIRLYYCMKMPM